MSDWIQSMQCAIADMEEHLTEPLDMARIAGKAHLSSFYFQRIFQALCGMTVSEYIRARRMTLAGEELATGAIKVIDAALKYGYESPDSFARAFVRFHGILPSAARLPAARLNAVLPLHIHVRLEGGVPLEYRIVEKGAFTLLGLPHQVDESNSQQSIPALWSEHIAAQRPHVEGQFGLCLDDDTGRITYLIADLYQPWKEVPEGYTLHTLPAGTWAVFPCCGALPQALQAVNGRIWKEWLPATQAWKLSGRCTVERYTPHMEGQEDYSEIWVPVVPSEA